MKIKKNLLLFVFLTCLATTQTEAQLLSKKVNFTHADTLRGSNGPGRDWWDVIKYDLHVKFNIDDSTISGYNVIQFKVLKKGSLMQIDLQEPMILDSVKFIFGDLIKNNRGPSLRYHTDFKNEDIKRDGNAYIFSVKEYGSGLPVTYL